MNDYEIWIHLEMANVTRLEHIIRVCQQRIKELEGTLPYWREKNE
jgi:hypothetical protein